MFVDLCRVRYPAPGHWSLGSQKLFFFDPIEKQFATYLKFSSVFAACAVSHMFPTQKGPPEEVTLALHPFPHGILELTLK